MLYTKVVRGSEAGDQSPCTQPGVTSGHKMQILTSYTYGSIGNLVVQKVVEGNILQRFNSSLQHI